MSTLSKLPAALLPLLLCARFAAAADVPPTTAGDLESTRQAFVAAMQRVRLHLPETPDSPALEAYAIHDYLVAARLRRDLSKAPADALDTAIEAFLQAHVGQ